MSILLPGQPRFAVLRFLAVCRRRAAVALATALAVPLALVPLTGASAEGRSDAAFDARCAQLAASRFDVVEEPIRYELEDGSQTIDQLTVKSGHTPSTHLTFGLTTVRFGYDADTEIAVVEETETRRVCGALSVHAKLSMQPVVVYLAQELGTSPCARAVTLEHELKHIAVFQQVLTEATRDLNLDIAGTLGQQVRRASTRDELERTTNARLKDYLHEFLQRWQRTLDDRQAAVDSPAEYARVKGACVATNQALLPSR